MAKLSSSNRRKSSRWAAKETHLHYRRSHASNTRGRVRYLPYGDVHPRSRLIVAVDHRVKDRLAFGLQRIFTHARSAVSISVPQQFTAGLESLLIP